LRGKIATALATLRHLADVESNWGAHVAKTLAIALALIAQLVLVEASFLQSDASVRLCDRAALKGRLIGASGRNSTACDKAVTEGAKRATTVAIAKAYMRIDR